ncbi:hypothetical protein ABH924_001082 [Arthrobacter sp. GAS37]
MNKYSDVSIGDMVLAGGCQLGTPSCCLRETIAAYAPRMGNKMIGLSARESKREILKQRLQMLTYVGLAILAVATVVVVVIALRR